MSGGRPIALVVDDEPLIEMEAVDVFHDLGYEAIGTRNADQAMLILRARDDVALVFTDIEMPETNGFEFVQSLRQDARSAGWPVIALSSVVSAEAIERGRRVGLSDYVAKFDRQGLIAALKEQTDVGRAA